MAVKVEKLEKNTIKLEITVDAETFEKGMQKSYQRNVGQFNVPGFRKGKAPRKLIEKMYGESVFYEDAINISASEAYEKVLKDENIEAVDSPEIDIVQIGSGKDLIFTAKVTVKPEVKLGKYKGVEVESKKVAISDEDVENELKSLNEKNARILDIEDRPLQNGDMANINFEGFLNGVAFPGGKGENYDLEIGSGSFIPGFEEQLIGMNLEEEKEINVKFPEEYHSEDLAGKDAMFKVKVNAIKVKELPAMDDEFAKDVSEFDTLDDLKKDIRKKLEHEAEHKAHHELENDIIKKVSDEAEIEIPDAMVDRQVEDMLKDFAMRLRYQGLDINKYMQLTGSNPDSMKAEFRPQAIEQVRGRLVLEAVAKQEGLDVSEDEVNSEVEKLAKNYNQDVEHFKQHLSDEDIKYIKEGVMFDKAIKFLVDNSKTVSASKKKSKEE